MALDYTKELDPEELQHSRFIVALLHRCAQLEDLLQAHADPDAGTPLAGDAQRLPRYPVADYAYAQLATASGCIDAIEKMIVREDEDKTWLAASPYGAYALIRNAMDAAATALWLLEPVNGTLRIKRRLMLAADEVRNASAFRTDMGLPGVAQEKKRKRERISEGARQAALNSWNPLKAELPTMTKMLRALERHHRNTVIPWLPAWQLSSGHAHGRMWAHAASQDLKEVPGTGTEHGAQFHMSIRYGMLAVLLLEAVQLIETAQDRYLTLGAKPT